MTWPFFYKKPTRSVMFFPNRCEASNRCRILLFLHEYKFVRRFVDWFICLHGREYLGRDLKIFIKDSIKMWCLIITHNSKSIKGRFTKFGKIGVNSIARVCCKSQVSTWIRLTSAGVQRRRYCCCHHRFMAALFFRSLPSNSGTPYS